MTFQVDYTKDGKVVDTIGCLGLLGFNKAKRDAISKGYKFTERVDNCKNVACNYEYKRKVLTVEL